MPIKNERRMKKKLKGKGSEREEKTKQKGKHLRQNEKAT